MKRAVAVILIILVMLITFGACSSKNQLTGTWIDEDDGSKTTYEFRSDGILVRTITYYHNNYTSSNEATYRVDGDSILLHGSILVKYKIEGNNLTIIDGDNELHFKKQ